MHSLEHAMCGCPCHGIYPRSNPPKCICSCVRQSQTLGRVLGGFNEVPKTKLTYQVPNPTNVEVFKESVLSHIQGINKIINLYKSNQDMKHAQTLLEIAYGLIIKGLAANDG